LWDITRGSDVQYFEARANGNLSFWDYRGDAFQNGQDCYVKRVAFVRYGGSSTIDVFDEQIGVDIDIEARQVIFTDSNGVVEFPRLDDVASVNFEICGGDSNNFGAIPGLWDITLGNDIQYFEAFADGNVTVWDYQRDSFNNGQDCYVKSSSYFQYEGELTIEVLGEGIVVNIDTTGGQIKFNGSAGKVEFPRVLGITSGEFTVCE